MPATFTQTNTGLKIITSAQGMQIAARFSRSMDDQLVYSISVSDAELVPRYMAAEKAGCMTERKVPLITGMAPGMDSKVRIWISLLS